MVDGKKLIEKLLIYADAFLGLNALDVIYQRNYLLHLFGFTSPTKEKLTTAEKEEIRAYTVPDVLVDEIMAFALENKLANNEIEADLFANFVFGIFCTVLIKSWNTVAFFILVLRKEKTKHRVMEVATVFPASILHMMACTIYHFAILLFSDGTSHHLSICAYCIYF